VRPDIKVIGVQTTDSDAMDRSIKAGRRVTLTDVGLFADGTAVRLVGEETFRVAKLVVDEIILVDTAELCTAIKDIFQDTRSIVEPSGALALAGAKAYLERARKARKPIKNESLITIACGANLNFDRLRFVAEMADSGTAREAVFAVTLPEERGSFKRFCELIGPRNVTEFNYRISDDTKAHVFVGVQVSAQDESAKIAKNFDKHGFKTLDLTHDELARVHIRHLVGGKSALAKNELLYRFEFPERPGALMRFLDSMAPNWNISLFHYRSQGGDVGRILVGLQVPKKEMKDFRAFLSTLGYRYWDESENPVYKLFL
jgi:threonine dehydratase